LERNHPLERYLIWDAGSHTHKARIKEAEQYSANVRAYYTGSNPNPGAMPGLLANVGSTFGQTLFDLFKHLLTMRPACLNHDEAVLILSTITLVGVRQYVLDRQAENIAHARRASQLFQLLGVAAAFTPAAVAMPPISFITTLLIDEFARISNPKRLAEALDKFRTSSYTYDGGAIKVLVDRFGHYIDIAEKTLEQQKPFRT
jgi:hypothetical protein